MALFPAYSSENTESNGTPNLQSVQDEEIGSAKREESNIYLDELKLLQSTSDSDQSDSPVEKQPLIDRQMKRKRSDVGSDKESAKKKKKKRRKKSCSPIPVNNDDFYIDKKLDYGNLRVSTLYLPGRPRYHYEKHTIGDFEFPTKKKKLKVKRYFQVSLTKIDVEEQLVPAPQESNSNEAKLASFINISDSVSKLKLMTDCMLAKAATFMDSVRNNPNNIDLWLEYVEFQKEFFALEKCHGRVNEDNAQNLCHDKQLAILDKALILNPYNMSLLSTKVTIAEQRFSNADYSAMLKVLIKNSDKDVPDAVICHLWCWYVEAVQCSMALCYVSRVTEMYQQAVTTLSKRQGGSYQATHVELTFRFGLFLRQCGMWEQLWTLIKLNAEINLDTSGGSSLQKCFQFDDDDEKEIEIENREAELTSSGLPLSAVWVRVEQLRSAARWRATSRAHAHDLQRCVDPAQLEPMILPVTHQAPAFTLAVHLLRLLKVPLLPLRSGLLNALHLGGIDVRWQYDAIEDVLPLLYAGFCGPHDMSQGYLASVRKFVAEFVEQPHYFSDSQGYLTFVNDFFLTVADWFPQRGKTAVLVWWIRFQTLICSLNSTDKDEGNRIRKQVQKVLKVNRGDVILYGEFARLETTVTGRDRGLDVAQAVLRNTKPDKGLAHTYLSRCYVELLLQSDLENKSECQMIAVNVLISLALGKPLPKILTTEYLKVDVLKALERFYEQTDTLLLRIESDKDMSPCEYMVPTLCVEWVSCCAWLVYLVLARADLDKLLHKLLVATDVHKQQSHNATNMRRLWLRENVYEWFTKVLQSNIRITPDTAETKVLNMPSLLKNGLSEFPNNAYLSWEAVRYWSARGPTGRCHLHHTLTAGNGNTLMSLALVLREYVRLYSTEDESPGNAELVGLGNRLRVSLVRLCAKPELRHAALLWKLRLHLDHDKRTLYLALDDCPWNKGLYVWGCKLSPPEFSELVDLVLEKQLRLHAMPEELEPL